MKDSSCNIIILLLTSMIFLLTTSTQIVEYTFLVIGIIILVFFAYITISKAPDLMKQSVMGMIALLGVIFLVYYVVNFIHSTIG